MPPAKLFGHAASGCSNRRRQAVRVQSSRDGGGVDQRISRCASRGCAVVAWSAAQGGQLQNGGKRNSNRVAQAHQLSKAACADAAPPLAYASMSALPSSFSRRCLCACAGISCMTQFFLHSSPRWLRGGLHVYDARGTQIAGGGISSMGQSSFTAAPRELHGELRVYVARGVQIAGGGAPQLGPNRP